MTNDKRTRTVEEIAKEIVYKGPWPTKNGAKLYPLPDRDLPKQALPELVNAISEALTAERRRADKLKEDNDILSAKYGHEAYDAMRNQRDQAVHAHQKIEAFYSVAVKDLENFREHHKILESRLQEAEDKCKFQATHYELSIKELEAENERLKSEHISGCMFHRCSKHVSVRQINTKEFSGAECGACIQEDMKQKDVNGLPMHLRLDMGKVLILAKEKKELEVRLEKYKAVVEAVKEVRDEFERHPEDYRWSLTRINLALARLEGDKGKGGQDAKRD